MQILGVAISPDIISHRTISLYASVHQYMTHAGVARQALLRTLDLLNTVQAISAPGSEGLETNTAFPALSAPADPSPKEREGGGNDQAAPGAVSAEAGLVEVCLAARARTRWNAQAAADARPPPPAVVVGSAPAAVASAGDVPLPLVGDAYYAAKERLIWVRIVGCSSVAWHG